MNKEEIQRIKRELDSAIIEPVNGYYALPLQVKQRPLWVAIIRLVLCNAFGACLGFALAEVLRQNDLRSALLWLIASVALISLLVAWGRK